MIQRIQSLWLLLAATCSLLTIRLPFYTGNNNNNLYAELNSLSHFLLLVLAVAVALVALITVFLFKNRKLQLRLSFMNLVLSAAHLGFLFLQQSDFKATEAGMHLWSVIYFIIPVLLILAMRGIYKDEQLVKGMDRLR